MRRLSWTWLLPLLLLLGQHGQFRHELDHYDKAAAASKSQKQRPADVDRCALCLAYGHLAGAANPHVSPPSLRGDLRHRLAEKPSRDGVDADLPAARNRGPPTA